MPRKYRITFTRKDYECEFSYIMEAPDTHIGEVEFLKDVHEKATKYLRQVNSTAFDKILRVDQLE